MAAIISCPVIGSVTSDAATAYSLVTMHTLTLATPDATFSVNGDAFNHFQLSQANETGGSAVFDVSIPDVEGFKAALGNWVKTSIKTVGGGTPYAYMHGLIRSYVEGIQNSLAIDGIGEALQTNTILDDLDNNHNLTYFNGKVQEGVDNLVTQLVASQEALDSIGLQFPYTRYPEEFSNKLPADANDKLIFQFVVTTNLTISQNRVDDIASAANGADVTPLAPDSLTVTADGNADNGGAAITPASGPASGSSTTHESSYSRRINVEVVKNTPAAEGSIRLA